MESIYIKRTHCIYVSLYFGLYHIAILDQLHYRHLAGEVLF